ncbi:invasion protein [Pseudomonas sp. PP3]|uniref:SpaN/EivJ family type III secretion system needle length determinant n=1 Tax=Pseudomonas sp. PP3 TaxID=2815936 RepID=UPI001BAECE89|nr:invasion protein [Pseudomonas sp. PP3]
MSDVSVISPIPVQVLDPVTDGSMDELRDTLVPVQEEDLPQGVLDLLAALIQRQRSTMKLDGAQASQLMSDVHGRAETVHHKAPPPVPLATTYAQADRPIQPLPPQMKASIEPSVDRVEMPVPGKVGDTDANPRRPTQPPGPSIERVSIAAALPLIERTSSTKESPPVERITHPVTAEPPLPQALQLPPATTRHAVTDLPPTAPAAPTLRPVPPADVRLETLPGTDRGLLQVPFNKGTASGQVTISRVPDEPTRSLQLSPSNGLVFDQLKVPFEQIREPVWRLTDSGGEQQRQDSQQSPEDEQGEQSELPA